MKTCTTLSLIAFQMKSTIYPYICHKSEVLWPGSKMEWKQLFLISEILHTAAIYQLAIG